MPTTDSNQAGNGRQTDIGDENRSKADKTTDAGPSRT